MEIWSRQKIRTFALKRDLNHHILHLVTRANGTVGVHKDNLKRLLSDELDYKPQKPTLITLTRIFKQWEIHERILAGESIPEDPDFNWGLSKVRNVLNRELPLDPLRPEVERLVHELDRLRALMTNEKPQVNAEK